VAEPHLHKVSFSFNNINAEVEDNAMSKSPDNATNTTEPAIATDERKLPDDRGDAVIVPPDDNFALESDASGDEETDDGLNAADEAQRRAAEGEDEPPRRDYSVPVFDRGDLPE
jgi:hypothetical protein